MQPLGILRIINDGPRLSRRGYSGQPTFRYRAHHGL